MLFRTKNHYFYICSVWKSVFSDIHAWEHLGQNLVFQILILYARIMNIFWKLCSSLSKTSHFTLHIKIFKHHFSALKNTSKSKYQNTTEIPSSQVKFFLRSYLCKITFLLHNSFICNQFYSKMAHFWQFLLDSYLNYNFYHQILIFWTQNNSIVKVHWPIYTRKMSSLIVVKKNI